MKNKIYKWWFEQYSYKGNYLNTRTGIVFAENYEEAEKKIDSIWNDGACNFHMEEVVIETEGVIEI